MNVHAADRGRLVRALDTRTRCLRLDSDGVTYYLPIVANLRGRIASVESHGSNPWTRYVVIFCDGTFASGLVVGRDFAFADGNPNQRESA